MAAPGTLSKITVPCPECEKEITLEIGTMVNELITCPDCGEEWEIDSLDPVKLIPAPEEEYDFGE